MKVIRIINLGCLAITGMIAVGCGDQVRPPQKTVVRYVTVESAERSPVVTRAEYIAIVRGETETDLSFKVGGLLEQIRREGEAQDWQEGSPIKSGEVLARLKQTDFVAATQAAWAKRELDANQFKRVEELRSKGATSPQEYDLANAARQASHAAWEQADQALKDSIIRAPYDGTMLARLANPGETVDRGKTVLKVADLSHMSVELGVPEKLVGQIQVGKEIPVRVSALEGAAFTGKVSEVGVAAREGARLFKVVIKVENPKGMLKSGMTASVVLTDAATFPPGSVLVPLSTLVMSSQTGSSNRLAVFVVDAEGKARERAVKTDDIVRSSIVITEGLKAGEKVVSVGASNLYEGAPVDARPAEKLSP